MAEEEKLKMSSSLSPPAPKRPSPVSIVFLGLGRGGCEDNNIGSLATRRL